MKMHRLGMILFFFMVMTVQVSASPIYLPEGVKGDGLEKMRGFKVRELRRRRRIHNAVMYPERRAGSEVSRLTENSKKTTFLSP